MELQISDGVSLNAQLVMTGRGCIIGQSGSGKSFLMGIIAEQLLGLGLPFCIIDTEGEYASLKSGSAKAIIVGGGEADVPLDVDLEQLFRTSVTNSVPLILDMSDTVEKAAAVYKALDALYLVEEEMRRPYLVLIEEADKLAPQVVHQKINIIEELSVRGRKRGIGLIVATQRPSNISKNVLSQCSYGFVGKLTIENDLSAINQLFSGRSALDEIVNLETGEFMPFGIDYKQRFRVRYRDSFHMGGTPQIGDRGKNVNVDIDGIISKLNRSEGVHEKVRTRKKEKRDGTVEINTIPFRFTEQQAKEYAARSSKRRFGVFGRRIESPEKVEQKYMATALCTIRIPTGKKREFDERSIVVGVGSCIVSLDKKVGVKKLLMAAARLSPLEETLLKRIKSKRGIKKETLIKEGLLKKGSAAAIIRKLSERKVIMVKDDKLYSKDYSGFFLREIPDMAESKAHMEQIEGEPPKKDESEMFLKNLFPTCSLLEFSNLFVPIYEITLRNKNKVRVLRIDGMNGREILYT